MSSSQLILLSSNVISFLLATLKPLNLIKLKPYRWNHINQKANYGEWMFINGDIGCLETWKDGIIIILLQFKLEAALLQVLHVLIWKRHTKFYFKNGLNTNKQIKTDKWRKMKTNIKTIKRSWAPLFFFNYYDTLQRQGMSNTV